MTVHFPTPTTEQQRQHEAHKARQARLFGKPPVVNVIGKMTDVIEAVKPEPKEPDGAFTPKGFIKARCLHHGVSYASLMESGRMSKTSSATRRVIMQEVREQFPSLNIMQLARLFNRTHSTILYVMGHYPGKKAEMREVYARDCRAKELYLSGKTLESIAVELGVCVSTVKKMKRWHKWDNRPKPPKTPREEFPHEKEARRLYDQGMSLKDISASICMNRSGAWHIKKRWNWPDRPKVCE